MAREQARRDPVGRKTDKPGSLAAEARNKETPESAVLGFLARQPVPALICWRDGTIRGGNMRAAEMLSQPVASLSGTRLLELPCYRGLTLELAAELAAAIEHAPERFAPSSIDAELRDGADQSTFFSHIVSNFDGASALILAFDITGHVVRARELENHRLELEAIFNHAPVMIGLKAVDGRWQKVNPSFAKMLEMSPDEVTGKRSDEIWPPEIHARVEEHDRKILASGRTETQVITTTTHTGKRSVYGTKFAIRDSAGTLSQIGFVGVDVSDLVKAKNEAQLMSFRLKEAQRIGNVAYWTWDPETKELFWSDELFTLLRWDPATPPKDASEFFDRIHPDDKPAFLDRTRSVDDGARVTIEYRFIADDGSQIWLYDEAMPPTAPGGPKFGFIHDITERKETEIRLQASEKRLSLAKRIAGLGTWEVDQTTRSLIWSDEVYEIFGQDRTNGEVDVAGWMKLVHPDDHEAYYKLREESFARRRTYQIEYRALHPDGSTRIILEHGEHEFSADGTPYYTRGTVQDITELARLRSRVIEAQKLEATAALAGGLTHDFNNILGAIAGNLDIMEIRGAARLGFEPPLDRIRQAVRSGQSLTQRLLNFSQNEPPAPRPVSMNRAIENFAALARSSLGSAYSFDLRTPSEPLACKIDINGLETALLNQVLNSKQAMPDGGEIVITLSRAAPSELPETLPERSYVRVCVSDNGPGMEPEIADLAFDAFFTTKKQCGGTGLGLYMVRNFARQHGGDAVLVTAPGQGTRLTLFLPENIVRRAEIIRPQGATGQAKTRHRILVVEDQPGIRAFLEDCLVDDGFTVNSAGTPQEALEWLVRSGSAFDAMISDVNLGTSIDGFALARQCRALGLNFPILFVSGFADGAHAADAAADFDAPLIKKPFRVTELLSALNQSLSG